MGDSEASVEEVEEAGDRKKKTIIVKFYTLDLIRILGKEIFSQRGVDGRQLVDS